MLRGAVRGRRGSLFATVLAQFRAQEIETTMSPELSAFISTNGTLLILVVGALVVVGLVQWRKVRVAEHDYEFKKALLEKGTPVGDIEKASAAKARRGLIDQFAELSGGAKAGIIAGTVIVLIVALGCIGGAVHSVAFYSHAHEQSASAPQPAPAPVESVDTVRGHVFYLDLQAVANQKLTDVIDNGHSFSQLPRKRREYGGVPFQVGPGYVRLQGNIRQELPPEVNDVRVGMTFDRLHILHGTEYGAFGDAKHRFHVAEGTEIGRYRVRYADGSERSVPIVYGSDVRDAWNWDRSRPVSRGKVVWTGSSPGAAKEGVSLRLYLTTWDNPQPNVEAKAIDLVSAGDTAASPNCFALTAERAVK
jgi:hypothetical protein